MINMLYFSHSGLRYLVLLLAVLAAVYHAYAYATRQPDAKAGRVLMGAFVGVLDLQILLGLLLVVAGIYYPALMGHLVMMVLAAAAAHGASVMAKRAADARRAHGIRLLGVVLTLVLVAGGIMAIGRGIMETRAPMLGS